MKRAKALQEWFLERGCVEVGVDVLQPADPFLEMAGEDLRRRIFITSSEVGNMLCLRPEFTIPTCLHHIKHSIQTPCRYAYEGKVFRQRREGGNEFLQMGIEDLGQSERLQADVNCLQDAHQALEQLGIKDYQTLLGDRALFAVLVANIGLPKGWQDRLLRSFGDKEQMAAALQKLRNNSGNGTSSLPQWAQSGDLDVAEGEVAKLMKAANLPEQGGRTAREIAKRTLEKAKLEAAQLDEKSIQIIENFLKIDVPILKAAHALDDFEAKTGLDLGKAKDDFIARLDLLKQSQLDLSAMVYQASFGRKLDYYTGLFFEIFQGQNAIIGGGRYDRLLSMLGADEDIPAIGFSIDFGAIDGGKS